MKITKIGWVGKNVSPGICKCSYNEQLELIEVYWQKGRRDSWYPEDWPPRKVIMTIEDVK